MSKRKAGKNNKKANSKKALNIAAALAVGGSALVVGIPQANAAENSAADFTFDSSTGRITGYSGTSLDIVIPATINGVPVTKIGSYAFALRGLKSVVIPDSVTFIEVGAFANNNLTSVILPASVATISKSSFQNQNNSLVYFEVKNPEAEYGGDALKSNPNVVVKGYTDSTTESYASANGHRFESLGVLEKPNTPPSKTSGIPDQSTEVGKTLSINLNNYFEDVDSDKLTYIVSNYDQLNSEANVTDDGTLIFRTAYEGEYNLSVKSYDGKAYSEVSNFKVTASQGETREVVTTENNSLAPVMNYKEIIDLTLAGVGTTKSLFVDGLLNGVDLATASFTINSTDGEVVDPTYNPNTKVISFKGLKPGFSNIQLIAEDAEGNSGVLMYLVDVVEQPLAGLGYISNGTIYIGQDAYVVPLDQVYENFGDGDSVTYNVTVSKSDAETVGFNGVVREALNKTKGLVASLDSKALRGLFASVAYASDGDTNYVFEVPTGVANTILHDGEDVLIRLVNGKLVVEGKQKGIYDVNVVASANGVVSSPVLFRLAVKEKPTIPPVTSEAPPSETPSSPEGSTESPSSPTTPTPSEPSSGGDTPTPSEPSPSGDTSTPSTPPSIPGGTATTPEGTTQPSNQTPVPNEIPSVNNNGNSSYEADGVTDNHTVPQKTNNDVASGVATGGSGGGVLSDNKGTAGAKKGNGIEVKGWRDSNGFNKQSLRTITPLKSHIEADSERINVLLESEDGETLKIGSDRVLISIGKGGTQIDFRDYHAELDSSTITKALLQDDLRLSSDREDGSAKTITVPHYFDDEGSLHISTRYPQNIIISTNPAVKFQDIDHVFSKPLIEELQHLGIVQGTEATKYEPNKNLTRGEFVSMIARALEYEPFTENQEFKDVRADVFYKEDAQSLSEQGLIFGTSKNILSGERSITRQQVALIVYRMLLKEGVVFEGGVDHKFADSNKIGKEAMTAIQALAKAGIVNSGENVKFRAGEKITRAEMAKILMLSLKLTDSY